MFDVHFLVNPSYETSCFFYDQTGRSRPEAALTPETYFSLTPETYLYLKPLKLGPLAGQGTETLYPKECQNSGLLA
jgi:hypothetical protein